MSKSKPTEPDQIEPKERNNFNSKVHNMLRIKTLMISDANYTLQMSAENKEHIHGLVKKFSTRPGA
jgi:hypothetical protein